MKMKFIRYKDDHGLQQFVMFSNMINHDDMAYHIIGTDYDEMVVSAGFFEIKNDMIEDAVTLYGKSTSLGIEAKEDDIKVLKRIFSI